MSLPVSALREKRSFFTLQRVHRGLQPRQILTLQSLISGWSAQGAGVGGSEGLQMSAVINKHDAE